MALPILDGNQTATTLSSVITGGEHIVAHSVVSLGPTAISNITSAVSGIPISGTVTVGNLPDATNPKTWQTIGDELGSGLNAAGLTIDVATIPAISGTVTANVDDLIVQGYDIGLNPSFKGVQLIGVNWDNDTRKPINTDDEGQLKVVAGYGSPDFPISGTVTVGNSVTIGSLPAISGTVTANLANEAFTSLGGNIASDDGGQEPSFGVQLGFYDPVSDAYNTVKQSTPLPIAGAVTVGNSVTIGSCVTHGVRLQDASGNNLTSTSIGGVQRLNVSLASAATPGGSVPTFVNVYGGSDSGTVRAVAVDSNGRSVVTVSNFPGSTTVTVSALPSGALTTRFGSVTTANTAQITSAVTNASRKYLLAQNISAQTVTIGIGFSPTTTQGIQLTAGGGLTFDAFCPTGAVYWLGAVTGAAFTILEG